jgi:hypothetical protein
MYIIFKLKLKYNNYYYIYSRIMNHFRNKLTSPLLCICIGYIYVFILGISLYIMGFYKESTFFQWGPPITMMGKTIEDNFTFYVLLTLFLVHQLINNWINDVTYPWIINCIQDPKTVDVHYSNKISLLIVNMFALYSEVDMLVLIAGIMTQVSFFVIIVLANMISVTVINWQYIKYKNQSTLSQNFINSHNI